MNTLKKTAPLIIGYFIGSIITYVILDTDLSAFIGLSIGSLVANHFNE